jgi:hypothetical protein
MVDRTDFGELRESTGQRLIEFLNTDLDLGFMYASMAQAHEQGRTRERLLHNARKVMEAARHFEEGSLGLLIDAKARATIHERTDELERLLSTFPT